jgi:hypothetical protein
MACGPPGLEAPGFTLPGAQPSTAVQEQHERSNTHAILRSLRFADCGERDVLRCVRE